MVSEFQMYNDGWTPEDKRNALAHLKAIESFGFVYVISTLQRSFLYLKEAIVALLGKSEDITSGITNSGILKKTAVTKIRC